MEIEYRNEDLDRLETDRDFTAGFSRDLVKAFRKRIQAIRAAVDERTFTRSEEIILKNSKANAHTSIQCDLMINGG